MVSIILGDEGQDDFYVTSARLSEGHWPETKLVSLKCFSSFFTSQNVLLCRLQCHIIANTCIVKMELNLTVSWHFVRHIKVRFFKKEHHLVEVCGLSEQPKSR